MENTTFLAGYGTNATLKIISPDGLTEDHGVNLEIIQETCPIFAMEFEPTGPLGELRITIEASSPAVVICFLRFIYLGKYVLDDTDPEPRHLLLHTELYQRADIYDLPELQVEAYQNLAQDLELSCCYPEPPADLCETIRFVYQHLHTHQGLIDNILHYVVECFRYHNLSQNESFKQLFAENHQFSRDLSRMNMQRGFQDAGATEIIRLPTEGPKRSLDIVDKYFVRNDYPYELWTQGYSTDSAPEDSFSEAEEPGQANRHGLPYRVRTLDSVQYQRVRDWKRPRVAVEAGDSSASEDSSASDTEGFTLVRRPRILEPFSFVDNGEGPSNSSRPAKQPKLEDAQVLPVAEDHGLTLANDPFADPGNSSADDEFDFNDTFGDGMASSVDTIKPEAELDTEAQPDALVPGHTVPDSRDSKRSPFADLEEIEFGSSSDSDWSVVGKEEFES